LCLVCTFSVLSISSFEPWTSWSTVHAESTVINVVVSPNDINSIQITWWGIPTVSIIYIFLSFLIGEESRDALRWFRKLVYRLEKPRFGVQVMLPTQ
jgi:pheromone a factor receptor